MRSLRAGIAFLVLPGVVAGAVPPLVAMVDPFRADEWASAVVIVGCIVLAVGLGLLLWSVRDLCIIGRGTLAPWDPPRRLVVVGLYRFVRNPMYIAVFIIMLGWSIALGSLFIVIYAGLFAVLAHLRVVFYEEPHLHREFGEAWTAYAASVNRWLPRLLRVRDATSQ